MIGDYAYVADGPAGLRIMDVSDPANPVEVGFYDTPEIGAASVVVVGDYAYTTDGGKLRIIDVSDPANPFEVGSCDTPQWAMNVAVQEPYAYVADNLGGLRIINISDPTSPYEVGFSDAVAPFNVAVAGDYAFVADGDHGLCIINVLNPSDPVEISRRLTRGMTYGVAVAGDYAYATERTMGSLYIFDVSDPYNPAEVGFYDVPGGAINVTAVDDYAFVADEYGGMIILRYTGGERFTIAGYVQDSNGTPFSNVTIRAGFHQGTTDVTGTYTIPDLLPGTYTIIPALNGYAFYPPTRTVTGPPDATNQNFIILPPPVSTVVPPEREATLLLTDTQGLTTTIVFPAGSVTQTTTIVLTPTVVTGGINFAFAGHAFELEALRDGVSLPGFAFETPITVTIYYSDQDVRGISDESQLALMRWTGSEWEDAASTCVPPSGYARDLENNVLSVAICHLSTYALLGPPNYPVYLPLVMRNR